MAEPAGAGAPAVELRGITKRFPGVVANSDIHLKVDRGTVHAIVGENGAGKSTLMKILYGMYRPDEGEILIDGRDPFKDLQILLIPDLFRRLFRRARLGRDRPYRPFGLAPLFG